MEPAIMALVGVLLQVTIASKPADTRTVENLKEGDVDRVISSALRQLSTVVYNNLSTDRKRSIEDVQFKLASLFNDLQELSQTLSKEPNDLAVLNTEARKICDNALESIYGPGCNNSLLGRELQIVPGISTAPDDSRDVHTRPAPDSTIRDVDSTNLLTADRFASREGDSQEPCVHNSAVFGEASSRYGLLKNAIDVRRCGGIDGTPRNEHMRELRPTLLNVDPNAWSNLIYVALMHAPGHRMNLQEIYDWIIEHTDKVKEPSDKAWKNSVRHNLSINGDFIRVSSAIPTQDRQTSQGWTLRPSAIERGITSTTSHRKSPNTKTSVCEPEGNDRENRNFFSRKYGLSVPGCSAPPSVLENRMAQSYYAENERISSEPFDRDFESYDLDRRHWFTGSMEAGDSPLLDRGSSCFQRTGDVPPSIDECGHAAPNEIWFGGNDIRIMFTQAAFERFIRLWETHKQDFQGATSMHDGLNNNTESEPDIKEVCSRLIQLKEMKAVRSGLGALFDVYRARFDLLRFYEAYEGFKVQAQAETTPGGKFRHHRALPVDDSNDPIALQRARNTLAARKTRHKKRQLIEELTNRVKELEADLERTRSGKEFIAQDSDKTERDASSVGVASVVNNLLVDCLMVRNGKNFTPKQRAGQKKEIVRFSIEARKYTLLIKSFGLGILALMPQQCLFRFSKRNMKHEDSNMERDILSFVNENLRSVEFCRIIEQEYMTISRNNSDTTQPNPRHDIRLQRILASISPDTLENRSRPDLLAKRPDLVPDQGANSRVFRRHTQESYSTNRLPCIVCKAKKIHCSYEIDMRACEECRKRKIRCIKGMPVSEHGQSSGSVSPCFINTSIETKGDLGKHGENGTLQHRSMVDLTGDAGVAGPTIPGHSSYPGSAFKCRRCGKTDDCAWCPGPDGYWSLCGICGHQYLMGKLENATASVQPRINNHRARQFSPTLNENTEIFNGNVAGIGPTGTTSPGHQSAGKKRRASASIVTEEDMNAIKRARSKEASKKHRARKAQEAADLRMRNEALEAAVALMKSASGSG